MMLDALMPRFEFREAHSVVIRAQPAEIFAAIRSVTPAEMLLFSRYWRVIHAGSALIRRMWLRAIKRRAESDR